MQGEWAVYLLQISRHPPGLSRGACPRRYLSACTCLQAKVKLLPALEDDGARKKRDPHLPPSSLP